jgi:hypothetical protein
MRPVLTERTCSQETTKKLEVVFCRKYHKDEERWMPFFKLCASAAKSNAQAHTRGRGCDEKRSRNRLRKWRGGHPEGPRTFDNSVRAFMLLFLHVVSHPLRTESERTTCPCCGPIACFQLTPTESVLSAVTSRFVLQRRRCTWCQPKSRVAVRTNRCLRRLGHPALPGR